MNAEEKMIGSGGCQYISGVGPHTVKEGYCAHAAESWADNTQIKSITPGDVVESDNAAVTDETWMSKAIKDGKNIFFADPIAGYNGIVSITLNAAGDIMMLYLVPLRKE